MLVFATPTCLLGAWGYTALSGKGVMAVIGTMMCASVPLRRVAIRRGFKLGERALAAASVGWGVVVGGTSGAGIILLSLLLAAGSGAAVIATDAAISVAIGVAKVAVFGVAGAVNAQVIAVAVLIGFAAFPGAFVAKRTRRPAVVTRSRRHSRCRRLGRRRSHGPGSGDGLSCGRGSSGNAARAGRPGAGCSRSSSVA